MKMTFLEEQTPDAIDVVNKLEEKELADIIFKYGEERASRKIAKAIVEARKKKPIITTFDLVKVINDVMPRFFGQRIHPATKTFQALRIYVNDELGRLERALDQALEKVKTGGRVVVISFHSLEDRIVKNFFRASEQKEFGKILTKKPIVPTDEEQRLNPRARSAKLRAFEKTI
jgi:16S rRNA (cytosine1402-N4)-methyltransferase